jgi:hypothetical protein
MMMSVGGFDEHDSEFVDELRDQLVLTDAVLRLDVIEAASARLAAGDRPTDLDLAGTVVAHFA